MWIARHCICRHNATMYQLVDLSHGWVTQHLGIGVPLDLCPLASMSMRHTMCISSKSSRCKAEGGPTRTLVIGKIFHEPKLQASLSASIWHEPWRSTHVLHGLRTDVREHIHTYMFACECTCRSIYICTHAHGCSCDMFIWICMWYNSHHLSGLAIAHRGPGMPPHRVVFHTSRCVGHPVCRPCTEDIASPWMCYIRIF